VFGVDVYRESLGDRDDGEKTGSSCVIGKRISVERRQAEAEDVAETVEEE
jgi:hypothetical protein